MVGVKVTYSIRDGEDDETETTSAVVRTFDASNTPLVSIGLPPGTDAVKVRPSNRSYGEHVFFNPREPN
jgi:hypothetical protein